MSEERKIQEDEMDLIELAKTIWADRKFIFKVTGVFMILGLIIAFRSPVEYEASCKLLPESQEGSMSNLGELGGLAGLAGIDLGSMSSGGVLTPQLYPEIVNSLPFILDVLNDTVYFKNKGIRTSSFDYFQNIVKPSLFDYLLKYSIGLPGQIKKFLLRDELDDDLDDEIDSYQEFYHLSKEEWVIIENLKKRISLSIDDDTGLISITVEMPDPYAAAMLSKKIELMLTKSVIKYKTDKSLSNLEFVKESFLEAQNNYEQVQLKLAKITDRNRDVSSSIVEIEKRNVENEYNIAFEVYKGLASQVEQAKIKVKEETPVFTVLEPVSVPVDKSKPKRLLILTVFCTFGFFASCIYSLVVLTLKIPNK